MGGLILAPSSARCGVIILVLFGGKGKISELMGDVAKGIKSFKKGLRTTTRPSAAADPAEPSQHHRPSGPACAGSLARHPNKAAEGRSASGRQRPSMFDFDVGKLLLIGVVALIFIPPKDLPQALRQLGRLLGQARRMAT